MKWFLSILVFSSPALLLPGCTLIPQDCGSAHSQHEQSSLSWLK
ncbi:hypothetical protein [Chlamydia vaughanii]